jgi:hypothetical protein
LGGSTFQPNARNDDSETLSIEGTQLLGSNFQASAEDNDDKMLSTNGT